MNVRQDLRRGGEFARSRLRSPLKPRRFRWLRGERPLRRSELGAPVALAAAFLAGLRFRRACLRGTCRHPRHLRRNVGILRRRVSARR
jgi:hypothetical protein